MRPFRLALRECRIRNAGRWSLSATTARKRHALPLCSPFAAWHEFEMAMRSSSAPTGSVASEPFWAASPTSCYTSLIGQSRRPDRRRLNLNDHRSTAGKPGRTDASWRLGRCAAPHARVAPVTPRSYETFGTRIPGHGHSTWPGRRWSPGVSVQRSTIHVFAVNRASLDPSLLRIPGGRRCRRRVRGRRRRCLSGSGTRAWSCARWRPPPASEAYEA